jgi:hypothetical protein
MTMSAAGKFWGSSGKMIDLWTLDFKENTERRGLKRLKKRHRKR